MSSTIRMSVIVRAACLGKTLTAAKRSTRINLTELNDLAQRTGRLQLKRESRVC